MVREILVNDAAFNGKSEIHMQLKGSIFAGTQVQIIRDGDTLSVVFHTANGQSADLIRQNQEVLRNALLEERFQLSEVQIRTQGADADHGQGRSRGQRDAGEEWQMAEEGDE
jgi:flagellar hook-length control protein FliK